MAIPTVAARVAARYASPYASPSKHTEVAGLPNVRPGPIKQLIVSGGLAASAGLAADNQPPAIFGTDRDTADCTEYG